jgi:hypothetical protein
MHARWYKRELVRGSWATFAVVCYTCESPIAGESDDEGGPAAEAESGRTQ